MKHTVAAWFLFGALVLFSRAPAWASGSEEDAWLSKAEGLFLHYCAHCHGDQGDGDGYNAEYLDKEPADQSDTAFIAKKKNQQNYSGPFGKGA